MIGGQGLLGEQQAGAFVEIGTARAQDVGRPAEGLRHQVTHRDVDLALRRLRGVDVVDGSPGQERLGRRRVSAFYCDLGRTLQVVGSAGRHLAVEDQRSAKDLSEDYEELDEVAEEWSDTEDPPEMLSADDIAAIKAEIGDLRGFRDLAVSITENAKGQALLAALKVGFAKAAELGGPKKAIIFTQSRRTQDYLVRLLTANGYNGQLALFNGTNADPQSRAIYAAWLEANKGTDRVTGSRSADMRAALVDYFRTKASILIATEAAAEGINLQFCSMVVNVVRHGFETRGCACSGGQG